MTLTDLPVSLNIEEKEVSTMTNLETKILSYMRKKPYTATNPAFLAIELHEYQSEVRDALESLVSAGYVQSSNGQYKLV